eukprot:TRINITY_DN19202_c0_g1_i4.p1 TRINITY_DN19202_c0_g1~~TRINITY_DN19202_c0_g1_i4.p1  ORF type:complete len:604 (+),score=114.20 TRINITY_DN19202_c0_g1_i4:179-1990(+)
MCIRDRSTGDDCCCDGEMLLTRRRVLVVACALLGSLLGLFKMMLILPQLEPVPYLRKAPPSRPNRPNPANTLSQLSNKSPIWSEQHELRLAMEARKKSNGVVLYSEAGCFGEKIVVSSMSNEPNCKSCWDACGKTYPSGTDANLHIRSVQLAGSDLWGRRFYRSCVGTYHYDQPEEVKLMPSGTPGCYHFDKSAALASVVWHDAPDHSRIFLPQSYRVLYSAESATYFGYQAYAHLLGFKRSQQQTSPATGYTRLLTASEPDDLSTEKGGVIPTFTAARHPRFSFAYGPFNKPDVVDKFMQSGAATENVMVLTDPDNFLVQSVANVASEVHPGHGAGAGAFFLGNPQVLRLWRECICSLSHRRGACAGLPPVRQDEIEKEFPDEPQVAHHWVRGRLEPQVWAAGKLLDGQQCDVHPDHVAVPYFVHREDLTAMAPVWKYITVQILQIRHKVDPLLRGLQLSWCAEMYGYIFAAAALGVKHKVWTGLQLRDVEAKISWEQGRDQDIKMIHMGRAWFPQAYAHRVTPQWIHTEGRDLRPPGTEQVWCKCNWTAADQVPWPLPAGIDFVSNVTLTLIHDSYQQFGRPPTNKFRAGNTPDGYHKSFP